MRLLREVTAVGYALVAAAALVAPAAVLAQAARVGGIAPSLQALDLLMVSALVATGYAFLAWRRLRRQEDEASSQLNVALAAVNGLAVLSVLASLLTIGVLHELGALRAVVADQEWALLLMWAGVQVLAVVVAEAVERRVFNWL